MSYAHRSTPCGSRPGAALRLRAALCSLALIVVTAAGAAAAADRDAPLADAASIRGTLSGLRGQIGQGQPVADVQARMQRLREAFIAADARERDGFDAVQRHIAQRRLPARIEQRHREAQAVFQRESEATLESFDNAIAAKTANDAGNRIDALLRRLDRPRPAVGGPASLLELPAQPRAKPPRAPRRTAKDYAALSGEGRVLLADAGSAGLVLAAATVGLPTAEHLAQTEDVVFTDDIRALADELQRQPVAIVNWVRNHIEFVPGYGSVQGAGQTLLNRRGNAADTASLLIALLRASGIPARYVYGTVDLDADAAMNWLGDLPSPQAAVSLLQQAGVPAEAISSAGRISAIRFEHVWVEAYVDFEPSRGARNRVPDSWVPMDASVKELLHVAGIDLARDLRFDAESFIQRFAAASQRDPQTGAVHGIDRAAIHQQLQAYRDQVGRFIDSVRPDARVSDVLGSSTLVERHPEVLAAVLPYRVVTQVEPVLALPDSLRWKLRLKVYAGAADHAANPPMASLERSLPQLGGQRLALGFVPATTDDAEALGSYLPQPHADGSPIQPEEFPQQIPGYLIEMSARLLVDDDVLSSGGSLALGMPALLQTELFDPVQQTWMSMEPRTVEVGEYHALSVDGQGTGLPRVEAMARRLEGLHNQLRARQYAGLTRDGLTGNLLEDAGLAWFAVADVSDTLFAKIARAVSARQPSLLRAYVDAQTSFLYGIPTQVRFPGVALQVDRLASAVVTRETDASGAPAGYAGFRRAGLERASAYAHLTLERLFGRGGAQGASAVRALAQAAIAGTPIHRLAPDNLQAVLARIDLLPEDEDLLRNGVTAGRIGLASENGVAIGGWQGSGLVLADEASGAGDYRLSGGDSGRLHAGNMAWLALGEPLHAAGGALATLEAADKVHDGLSQLLGDSAGTRWRDYAAQPDVIGSLMLGFVSGAAAATAVDQMILLATADATTGTQGLDATANHAPVFTTTPPTQAVAGQPYRYAASAADAEGDPVRYGIVRGPGGLAVAASGLLSWDAPVEGEWLITLRADDGRAWREQTWSLTVDPAPEPLSATLSVSPGVSDPGAPLTITVSHSGGSGTVQRSLTLDGAPLVLPQSGVLQHPAPYEPGVYRLALTVSDDSGTLTREALVSVRNVDDSSAPLVEITTPEADAEVTGRIEVRGTATDDNLAYYQLLMRPTGAPDSEWREIARRSTPVDNGVLGAFDPTTLDNGLYQIALHAYDINGRLSTQVVGIEVYGEQKIGQFSVSFLDLEVEAAGIPIQVTRTYDTRRKTEDLDFGYGWSVDYQSLRLRKNMVLGLQWEIYQPTAQLSLCIRAVGQRRIAITLPDGKVERFTAKNAQDCAFNRVPEINILFEPGRGTTSELTALDVPNLEARGGQIYDMDDLGPWNPQRFKLRTEDGTEYILREGVGIERVKDIWGNTLDYRPNALVHSAGQSIFLDRDSAGRITVITDPSGQTIRYGYDAQGNLASVTDREGRITRFKYDRSHGLTEYTDPRGIVVARQIYDEQGRLIATIDADGQRTEVTHQTDSNRQIVRNRRGYETAYVYDGEGRVTEVTDALGHKTAYEYDANGNETRVTDPLGHVTAQEYNAANKLLKETDALGKSVVHDWHQDFGTRLWSHRSQTDARGNVTTYDGPESRLMAIHEPEGRSTRIGYDPQKGHLASLDIGGQVTQYGYNAKGQKISETDPNGHTTTLELDANGREIARSYPRTKADGTVVVLRHSRKLDAEGRVLEDIGPTGLKTVTTYNAAGKPETETDARGKVTRYEYDAQARLVKTIHPDGQSESVAYDLEGNEIEKTDRAGRITRHEYDALNRLIKTVHPDGSTERQEVDAAGRLIKAINAQGRVTVNAYDAAGRVTTVTDALGRTTAYGYDANGNRTSITDAQQQITRFEYDALNRLTRTILPDGSSTRVTWTPQGQKASETDASGKTTSFGYDAKGQLTSVTQHDGAQERVTRYGYDELGNKISQQDAEGKVTRWEYNDLSQVSARILPEGQRETFGYDANGNLIRHTDFNGKTTTIAYDDLNREIEKRYADGAVVKTTYTRSGQIETQTDGRGITRYQYDPRDRLTRVESPEGVIRYQYDTNGNRSLISTNHQNVQYGYDELNRLVAVTDAQGKQTTYGYDSLGRKVRVSTPNGVTTEYDYDANGRLVEIRHEKTATQTLLGAFHYTLSPNGQRTKLAERDQNGPTRTADYEYDGINRLTKETVTHHRDAGKSYATQWIYDGVGNRMSQTKTRNGQTEVTSYSYDGNDRLLTETRTVNGVQQAVTTYQYDANGNTTKKTVVANGETDNHVYTWNGDNRLTGYSIDGQAKASYRYEPSGIRTAKTTPNGTTQYLVDHNQAYAQVIEENDQLSSDPEVVYLHGDDLLQQARAGQLSYYHADGLGSTRMLTDEKAGVSDWYAYEAYGELAEHVGDAANEFLYVGEQYDADLSLIYLRARYMDEKSGRLLAIDPFEGFENAPDSLHKYLYARANPVSFTDPSGLMTLSSFGASFNIQSVLVTASRGSIQTQIRHILVGRPSRGEFGLVGEYLFSAMLGAVDGAVGSTARAFGDNAHRRLEKEVVAFNKWLKGNPLMKDLEVKAELYRDDGGVNVSPRSKDSAGLDVVVFYRGKIYFALDMKTGTTGWKPGKKKVYQRRFGPRIWEVYVKVL